MATASEPLTFVDTNVLVYAHDASEVVRQPIARDALARLWAARTGTLSTQVLQEFLVATTRQRIGMTPAAAREVVKLYSAWPVVLIDPVLILSASRLQEARQVSFWDALIIEAARLAGATRVLSEDLGHGTDFDGVAIENPFPRITSERPESPE